MRKYLIALVGLIAGLVLGLTLTASAAVSPHNQTTIGPGPAPVVTTTNECRNIPWTHYTACNWRVEVTAPAPNGYVTVKVGRWTCSQYHQDGKRHTTCSK